MKMDKKVLEAEIKRLQLKLELTRKAMHETKDQASKDVLKGQIYRLVDELEEKRIAL